MLVVRVGSPTGNINFCAETNPVDYGSAIEPTRLCQTQEPSFLPDGSSLAFPLTLPAHTRGAATWEWALCSLDENDDDDGESPRGGAKQKVQSKENALCGFAVVICATCVRRGVLEVACSAPGLHPAGHLLQ